MGYHFCDGCNDATYGDTAGCDACGSDGVDYCHSCASAATCDACHKSCCVACADARFDCCGKVLCGGGADRGKARRGGGADASDSEEACFWGHALLAPWPDCGHARCSEQPERCATCAAAAGERLEAARVAADRVKAQAQLASADTSESLKAVLRAWLANKDCIAAAAAQVESAEQEQRDEKRRRHG
jgi:hypothetical protein